MYANAFEALFTADRDESITDFLILLKFDGPYCVSVSRRCQGVYLWVNVTLWCYLWVMNLRWGRLKEKLDELNLLLSKATKGLSGFSFNNPLRRMNRYQKLTAFRTCPLRIILEDKLATEGVPHHSSQFQSREKLKITTHSAVKAGTAECKALTQSNYIFFSEIPSIIFSLFYRSLSYRFAFK